jgi:hypothetical protein
VSGNNPAGQHTAGIVGISRRFATDPVITACGDGSLYLVGKDKYNALWSGHYIPGAAASAMSAAPR